MRAIVMVLLVVGVVGRCFAEDPLESLNTVEDTISTMQNVLKEQGNQMGEGKAGTGNETRMATGDLSHDGGASQTDGGPAGVRAPSKEPSKNFLSGEK
ncbi:hypothetical protein [Geomonas sp.]|uniref:hypothetical protein n=1 Tax=Geomonas sp. TaxID=2651584 RepID=UPI002B4A81F0|nr:hypothetical protein [Geomonas sp.]HJV36690.1 hypothetical protein [Geomonas sp.]